jgi:hypothetical protein
MSLPHRSVDHATVALTVAQRSALECAGLELAELLPLDDEDAGDAALLLSAWNGATRFRFADVDRDAVIGALIRAANSEDATAEDAKDADSRRRARGACAALSNLARVVRRAS